MDFYWELQGVLESLPAEMPRDFVIADFHVTELSQDVMLATYKVTSGSTVSLRSSIWKQRDDQWQIIFHQGTKCEGPCDAPR